MSEPTRTSSSPLALGLVALLLAFAATFTRVQPPAPVAADAPVAAFSAERAREVLHALVGDGVPHPIGSDANARVRARIVERFTALGYETEVHASYACSGIDYACGTVHNVIAQRPAAPGGRAVLVVSHYDSVQAGPGASDAGISVAAILEVARALSTGPASRNPVVFLVDDGEEAGLLGASGFVNAHPLAKDVGVVVNLEARGTTGPSVMFETSGENAWLVDMLAASLPRPMASSLFYPIYERLPNDTDLTVFKQAGTPGVNLAFIGGLPRYHSPRDNIDHADPASLQHQGENALATVRALASTQLDRPPAGSAVFFDVLGFGIVRWPIGITTALASLAFVMVAVATVAMRRIDDAPLWRAAVGFAAWVVGLAVAGLAAWGLFTWLTARDAWPGGATTRPGISVLAFWLTGIGLSVTVAAIAARWSKPAGAWCGCWLAWSMAAVAAAIYFPEAGYVLIVPALVAGTTGFVAAVLRQKLPGTRTSILPLSTAAILLMPPAWMLFDALGPTALPIVGIVMALVATALAPLVAWAGAVRWLVALCLLSAAGSLVMLALEAPAFSTERPERLNVVYFHLSGEQEARWIATPQSGSLPPAMREAAPFGENLTPAFPWSRAATSFVADALPSVIEAPAADMLERRTENGRTTIRLRAASPRQAQTISLFIPAARLVSVTMGGTELPRRPADSDLRLSQRDGGSALRRLTAFTVPAGGVEIVLVVAGAEPLEGFVADYSPGLPPGGDAIAGARPAEALPNGTGDLTVVARRLVF